jgi:hypothetical protein
MLLFINTTLYGIKSVPIENKIAGLYIAYFNRAPDMNGLSYWKNKGEEAQTEGIDISVVLKDLSASFALHPTFTRTYGDLNNSAFVRKVYINALGREGDSNGIDYWTNRLNLSEGSSGYLSRSDFVSVFVEAALTFDSTDSWYENLSQEELDAAQLRQDLLANKVEVALAFVSQLQEKTNVQDNNNPESEPAYLASIKVVEDITEEHTTVEKMLDFLQSAKEIEDPITAILDGKLPYGARPSFVELSAIQEGIMLSDTLVPSSEAMVEIDGLKEGEHIELYVPTIGGQVPVTPSNISIEDGRITFQVPSDIVDGNLSILIDDDIKWSVPYEIVTTHAPILSNITPKQAKVGDNVVLE